MATRERNGQLVTIALGTLVTYRYGITNWDKGDPQQKGMKENLSLIITEGDY